MRVQVSARNRAYQFEAAIGEKILFAGLGVGIGLPYECATGTCGTCKATLIDGKIDDTWAGAPGKKRLKAEQGEFLMCQCIARGDLAIEVSNIVHTREAGSCPGKAMRGTIYDVRYLTRDVAAIDIRLDANCSFDAGQFMAVSAPGVKGMRGYSMVNFARDTNRLEFVIKKKPSGGFSEWLFGSSVVGAKLDMFGPLGKAVFYPSVAKNILCVAGGSGIAGMMSILSRARHENYFEQYFGHVYFGVRTMVDAFYLDELSGFRKDCQRNLSITVALSDEDVPGSAVATYPYLRFERGFVHEVAKREMAGKYENVRAYLAGPPVAVDAAIRMLLLDAKLSAENIRYDKYS